VQYETDKKNHAVTVTLLLTMREMQVYVYVQHVKKYTIFAASYL